MPTMEGSQTTNGKSHAQITVNDLLSVESMLTFKMAWWNNAFKNYKNKQEQ